MIQSGCKAATAMASEGARVVPTEEELLAEAEIEAAEEPDFEAVADILEVQADPLLGYGAFGTVHYAVLKAECKTVALKAVSKAATRAAAAEGGSSAGLREILFGEAMYVARPWPASPPERSLYTRTPSHIFGASRFARQVAGGASGGPAP